MIVEISSPDKVLFPDDGLTKADVAGYYDAVSEWMLQHIRNRPLSLMRFPDGIDPCSSTIRPVRRATAWQRW